MASASTAPIQPTVQAPHFEKPEKFSGVDFKIGHQKMLFYLTTLNLVKFLQENAPAVSESETDKDKRVAYDVWKNGDYFCRNYILNGLDNTLYNVYSQAKTSKDMCKSLKKKYLTEDAGMKKFIELQLLLHYSHAEGMHINEAFQVASIIEKLPPSWKDFKNYLKHKRKDMELEDLIVRLRIEEDNRKHFDPKGKSPMDAKTNLMELNSSKKKKFFGKGKTQVKAKRFNGMCYNCGKPNHMAKDCRRPKKANRDQINMFVVDRVATYGET
ncbi:uncharacterized protein [Henckelia pumila]|uniref:uncharacterized protein n=1 Tax=Henckelia pumila TaxID=405737 RepID=UPI003C6E9A78